MNSKEVKDYRIVSRETIPGIDEFLKKVEDHNSTYKDDDDYPTLSFTFHTSEYVEENVMILSEALPKDKIFVQFNPISLTCWYKEWIESING